MRLATAREVKERYIRWVSSLPGGEKYAAKRDLDEIVATALREQIIEGAFTTLGEPFRYGPNDEWPRAADLLMAQETVDQLELERLRRQAQEVRRG